MLDPKTINQHHSLTQNSEQRVFRTALDSSYYLRFEYYCLESLSKPFAMAKLILSTFLDGGFLILEPVDSLDRKKGYRLPSNLLDMSGLPESTRKGLESEVARRTKEYQESMGKSAVQ